MTLDKHYTNDDLAQHLIDVSSEYLNDCDIIIEPSAGGGSISNKLDRTKLLAFDISPDEDSPKYIKKCDFLKYKHALDGDKVMTIGNPPFGYRAQGAVSFFNKAAEFSSCISFILPRSFRKSYVINQLNEYFHLIHDESVDVGSFKTNTEVRCCIQTWKRKQYKRRKIETNRKSMDFVHIPQGKKFNLKKCDFAIRRTGFKNVGECITKVENALPITQFIFFKILSDDKDSVINNVRSIKKDLFNYAYENTAMAPTFAIDEFIDIFYSKSINKENNNLMDFV